MVESAISVYGYTSNTGAIGCTLQRGNERMDAGQLEIHWTVGEPRSVARDSAGGPAPRFQESVLCRQGTEALLQQGTQLTPRESFTLDDARDKWQSEPSGKGTPTERSATLFALLLIRP